MDIHSQICASTHLPVTDDILLDRLTWLAGALQTQDKNVFAAFNGAQQRVQREMATETLRREHELLSTAQTVFVSKDIMEEVDHARNTMPDNILLPQDVFVPNGMLIFEEPLHYDLTVTDGFTTNQIGQPITELDALESWSLKAVQFCVMNSVDYTSPTDKEHYDGIEVRFYGNWKSVTYPETNEVLYYDNNLKASVLNREGLTYQQVTGDLLRTLGESAVTIETMDMLNRKAVGSPITMFDATFFRFNYEGAPNYAPVILGMKRTLIALFRLTYSYLAQIQEEAPRHVIKRAKRANRKIPENGYLTVLKLRRTEYEKGDGTHSSPKYAFRVRGHWKRAYLRSTGLPVGDPNAYRYVYVSDYIKGKTANKEMRESTRVINIIN